MFSYDVNRPCVIKGKSDDDDDNDNDDDTKNSARIANR